MCSQVYSYLLLSFFCPIAWGPYNTCASLCPMPCAHANTCLVPLVGFLIAHLYACVCASPLFLPHACCHIHGRQPLDLLHITTPVVLVWTIVDCVFRLVTFPFLPVLYLSWTFPTIPYGPLPSTDVPLGPCFAFTPILTLPSHLLMTFVDSFVLLCITICGIANSQLYLHTREAVFCSILHICDTCMQLWLTLIVVYLPYLGYSILLLFTPSALCDSPPLPYPHCNLPSQPTLLCVPTHFVTLILHCTQDRTVLFLLCHFAGLLGRKMGIYILTVWDNEPYFVLLQHYTTAYRASSCHYYTLYPYPINFLVPCLPTCLVILPQPLPLL